MHPFRRKSFKSVPDGTILFQWATTPWRDERLRVQIEHAHYLDCNAPSLQPFNETAFFEQLFGNGLYYYAVVAGNVYMNSSVHDPWFGGGISIDSRRRRGPTWLPISPNPSVRERYQVTWTAAALRRSYYIYRIVPHLQRLILSPSP